MCRMLVGNMSWRMHDLKQFVHEALRLMGYMPIQDYLPFLGYWYDPEGGIKDMQVVRLDHSPAFPCKIPCTILICTMCLIVYLIKVLPFVIVSSSQGDQYSV